MSTAAFLKSFPNYAFTLSIIIPRQHGGDDEATNLALACPDCNLRKGPNLTGIDPESGEVVRLFHPRRDHWDEHFAHDGRLIIGSSAIGRTTAALLEVNDPERQRIRELMAEVNK